jgi:hypothetical protein
VHCGNGFDAGSARLAQETEERCCTRSRLIKTPDRISEKPQRGGFSFGARAKIAMPPPFHKKR